MRRTTIWIVSCLLYAAHARGAEIPQQILKDFHAMVTVQITRQSDGSQVLGRLSITPVLREAKSLQPNPETSPDDSRVRLVLESRGGRRFEQRLPIELAPPTVDIDRMALDKKGREDDTRESQPVFVHIEPDLVAITVEMDGKPLRRMTPHQRPPRIVTLETRPTVHRLLQGKTPREVKAVEVRWEVDVADPRSSWCSPEARVSGHFWMPMDLEATEFKPAGTETLTLEKGTIMGTLDFRILVTDGFRVAMASLIPVGKLERKLPKLSLPAPPPEPIRSPEPDGPVAALTGQMLAVAFAPSGRELLAISDGEIRVLAAPTWTKARAYGYGSDIEAPTPYSSICLSTDARLIGLAEDLVDLTTGERVQDLRIDGNHRGGSLDRGQALSPDGKLCALAGYDDEPWVAIWSLAEPRKLAQIPRKKGICETLRWSPDGARIAGKVDSRVVVWNVASRVEERAVDLYAGGLAFSPDGKKLAALGQKSGGAVGIILIDVGTGSQQSFPTHWDVVSASSSGLAFTPDGTRITGGGDNGEHVTFDVASGHEIARWKRGSSKVTGLAYSPDGKQLASCTWGGSVYLREPGK